MNKPLHLFAGASPWLILTPGVLLAAVIDSFDDSLASVLLIFILIYGCIHLAVRLCLLQRFRSLQFVALVGIILWIGLGINYQHSKILTDPLEIYLQQSRFIGYGLLIPMIFLILLTFDVDKTFKRWTKG
jgi:hypothetical protein